MLPCRLCVTVEERRCGFGGEDEAVELLADDVVQVEREAVALGDHGELAALFVEACVGDRDRGVRGQQLDQLLVRRAELRRALLLGQVEGADHAPVRDDRHAEERAHVGMAARPPATEARVLVDVGRAVRLAGLEHRSQHAVLARQRPERGDQLVAHARGEEAAEAPVAVGQPERGVARARQLARGVHEPLEHLLHRQLGGHAQHGVAHSLEGRGHHESLGHHG